jgi:glutathione S-transferase
MDECKNRAPGSLEWKDGDGEQMVDEEAIDAAWNTLKPKLGPKNWTVGESFTYRGFFSWGWEARKQYIQPEIDALKSENEKLRKAAQPVIDDHYRTLPSMPDHRQSIIEELEDAMTAPDTKGGSE